MNSTISTALKVIGALATLYIIGKTHENAYQMGLEEGLAKGAAMGTAAGMTVNILRSRKEKESPTEENAEETES